MPAAVNIRFKTRPRDSVFFAGNWFLDGYNGEGYRQIMKIRGETVNDVIVDIDFSGAKKRMPFPQQGTHFKRANRNPAE